MNGCIYNKNVTGKRMGDRGKERRIGVVPYRAVRSSAKKCGFMKMSANFTWKYISDWHAIGWGLRQ